ncbi:PASTA domain-containing protein [Kribbella sp. NPDC051587]|uniref:PASTA domain-containing protein n=1 Tax=Kribbella sp. NPDC051587 TaxID=3364119 RepID=UPI0037AE5CCF
MNEAKLTELLERAGDRTAVNPPPIDAMRSGAARIRRRRTAVWSAAGTALAVAAVIGGSTALTNNTTTVVPQPPVAGNPVPEGMRLVGLGHVAIAVPKTWATNKLHCGTPTVDSVIVDPGPQGYCLVPRAAGVESIELGPLPADPAEPNAEIDGVPVAKQPEACTLVGSLTGQKVNFCSASVQIPSLKLTITAAVQGEGMEPTQMLERVFVVPDLTGVPGFQTLDLETSQAKYLAALKADGLVPEIVSKPAPGVPKGSVTAVSPVAGTMVPNGSTVTVTVAG